MLNIKLIQKSDNLTPFLTERYGFNSSYLHHIAQSVIRNYKIDLASREDWDETIDKAMAIAKQVMEEKNFPWPKASNIKLPLITEAAINFASRVYPEILPNNKIVQIAIQGKDVDGTKRQRAQNVESCMSYQQLSSPDWCTGVDHLLHILPVVGTVFKKTYWCEAEKRSISEVCSPKDIVVNYSTKSLETARRITHKIRLCGNEIIENQRRKIYNKDVSIDELRPTYCAPDDDDFEIELLEQHCWWDLDGDGYKEPYVVIVHETSGKVLRIVSIIDDIKYIGPLIVRITAEKYFTDYHFIPSPDGGYYSLGFGHLLLPINAACNTITNQLIDNGTLLNTQGGFISKGLRMRDGDIRFKPFEYRTVDAAPGDKLADGIFPFPVRDLSSTALNLLTFLIDMAKDLTKSTEAMNGDLTGSNVSQGTMNQMIEQGSKIFSAIYRRYLEAMTKEYQKLYKLNYEYLSNADYRRILDDQSVDVKKDFGLDSNDIRPVADPVYSSMEQRLSKITLLMNMRTVDPRAVDLYALQTLQFDDNQIKMLLPPPNPNQPPPAKDQKDLAQAQLAQAQAKVAELEALLMTQKGPLELQDLAKSTELKHAQIIESAGRYGKMQNDVAHNEGKLMTTQSKMQRQETLKQIQEQHKQAKDAADLLLKDKEINLKYAAEGTKLAIEHKKVEKMGATNNDAGSN